MVTLQLSHVNGVNHQRDKAELSKLAQVCLVVNSRGFAVAAKVQHGRRGPTHFVGYIKISRYIEPRYALKVEVFYTITVTLQLARDCGFWRQASRSQVGQPHHLAVLSEAIRALLPPPIGRAQSDRRSISDLSRLAAQIFVKMHDLTGESGGAHLKSVPGFSKIVTRDSRNR